ncbi:MAG: hypothetical protein HN729_12175 [Candidatus Marinimicrobia bacterium]|jgi:hypothetical protein|nr:hypothetical protein [Candidatus Neomarinimicrobiota bacterium]MBT3634269.1 hypothetical protein [Candidatus Neomarinimicrobiota bacterium]MBT3682932.1 hypothetical protein [Candidatus Neomarinimicrobiota bacterium]MBT3760078.1 hypothetical protein [Candidatus Neomarinimicrobiota bacterium]MBT3896155.1 hypothetical protein [Candidatus Neomarinimicrobiota bacterium]
MSDIWENTIQQLSKWGEVVADKSGFYFKKAVDKGEELTKLGRIQIEIEKIKRDIKHHYTDLGKFIYHASGDSGNTDFSGDGEYKSYIDDISTLKTELDRRYEEKESLKTESNSDEDTEASETEESVVEDTPKEPKVDKKDNEETADAIDI